MGLLPRYLPVEGYCPSVKSKPPAPCTWIVCATSVQLHLTHNIILSTQLRGRKWWMLHVIILHMHLSEFINTKNDRQTKKHFEYVTITTDSKSIWWRVCMDHKVYLYNTNNYQMQQLHLANVKYVSAHQTHFKVLGHKFRPPKNIVCLQKISQMTWKVTSLYWFNSSKNINSYQRIQILSVTFYIINTKHLFPIFLAARWKNK
jgi:hypothetical protein